MGLGLELDCVLFFLGEVIVILSGYFGKIFFE